VRRALLLFAIVLGMAALAASLSQPAEDRSSTAPADEPAERGPAEATPAPAPSAPAALSLVASENEAVRLPAGEAATLEVTVDQPGSVEIPGLGLSTSADHLTPARFDLLTNQPGRYELLFTPAGAEAAVAAGRLVVTSSG
jgi:cytoskeletal protein RodZ